MKKGMITLTVLALLAAGSQMFYSGAKAAVAGGEQTVSQSCSTCDAGGPCCGNCS